MSQDLTLSKRVLLRLAVLTRLTFAKPWHWSTVKNWGAASDVLAKFAVVLGAIAAANFFVLKPQVDTSTVYCLTIDIESIQEAFREQELALPDQILNLDENLSCSAYLSTVGISRQPIQGDSIITEPGVYIVKPQPIDTPELDYVPNHLEEIFNDHLIVGEDLWVGAFAKVLPLYAESLLPFADELGEIELRLALDALRDSRMYFATVDVVNQGQAAARNAKIEWPHPWTIQGETDGIFNLPPGGRTQFVFGATFGDVEKSLKSMASQGSYVWRTLGSSATLEDVLDSLQNPPQIFYVIVPSSEVIDIEFLSRIGLLLLGLWAAIVIKEIYFGKPEPESSKANDVA